MAMTTAQGFSSETDKTECRKDGIAFGFSAAATDLPVNLLQDAVTFPEFDALEISPDQLDSFDVFRRNEIRQHFRVISAASLLDPALPDRICSEKASVVNSFVHETVLLADRLRFLNISLLTLELPVARILASGSEGERKALKSLLRNLAPYLLERKQTLLLPCRIPALPGEASVDDIGLFLRDLMLPCVKLRLNVCPHELKKEFSPSSLANCWGFDASAVVFCSDAETGNTLVKAHIAPWISYMKAHGFRGVCLTAPVSAGGRLAVSCAENFAAILRTVV